MCGKGSCVGGCAECTVCVWRGWVCRVHAVRGVWRGVCTQSGWSSGVQVRVERECRVCVRRGVCGVWRESEWGLVVCKCVCGV